MNRNMKMIINMKHYKEVIVPEHVKLEHDITTCQKEQCMAWEEVPIGNGVMCKFKCRLVP